MHYEYNIVVWRVVRKNHTVTLLRTFLEDYGCALQISTDFTMSFVVRRTLENPLRWRKEDEEDSMYVYVAKHSFPRGIRVCRYCARARHVRYGLFSFPSLNKLSGQLFCYVRMIRMLKEGVDFPVLKKLEEGCFTKSCRKAVIQTKKGTEQT
jgi:hypothetical protein